MTLFLFDGAGLAVITGTLHTLGDAERAAWQHRLRRGHVEDDAGRRVARIVAGVMVREEEGSDALPG